MKLRPWVAMWAGVTVLAACGQGPGPLEQESGDLDNRIEKTAEIAAELERAASQGDDGEVIASGQ